MKYLLRILLATCMFAIFVYGVTPLSAVHAIASYAGFTLSADTGNTPSLAPQESTSTTLTIGIDTSTPCDPLLPNCFSYDPNYDYAPYTLFRTAHCTHYDASGTCTDTAPDLCPYLSAIPQTTEGDTGFPLFPQDTMLTSTGKGELNSYDDPTDSWSMTIAAPCFTGECPANYDAGTYGDPLPLSQKGKTFRCDMHVEPRATIFQVYNTSNSTIAYAQNVPNTITLSAVFTGATPPQPECTTDCNSNVLFLPGVAGSRLYEVSQLDSQRCPSDTGTSYFKRWLPLTDCDNSKLLLNPDGSSINHIVTKDAVDEAAGVPNIYASFLTDLKKWRDTDNIIAGYSVVPYDWRLSISDLLNKGKKNSDGYIDYTQPIAPSETPYIMSELLRMASSSRTHKVTIVAHSNGGLITKALMLQLRALGKENLVDKIIFVAVPEVGTPDAMATLLHGSDIGPLGLISNKRQTREISQNMPTAYNLLPSTEYYQTAISTIPIATFGASGLYTNERIAYGIGVGNYTEFVSYLLGTEGRSTPDYSDLNSAQKANSTLLTSAQTVHSSLDSWTPESTTKVVEVAGWGERTIAGLQYTSETYCNRSHIETQFLITKTICDEYTQKKILKNTLTVNGDQTVVSDSAHYLSGMGTQNSEQWWLDLSKHNELLSTRISRHHKDILEVASLRDFIKNQITDSSSSLDFISQTKPTSVSDVIVYDLHSPLSLNLYDDQGRHTGISTTTGAIEENIPSTRYSEVGETKYIIADAHTAQHLMLKGYASGSFSLGVQKLQGDTILASTTFSAIPSSTGTVVTMEILANTDLTPTTASPLKIDFNGDGIIDTQLVAKPNQETIYDITPPDAQLSFSTSTQQLSIIGIDAGGSTTVCTSTTSSLITDQAGNTTELLFSKYKIKPKKIELTISGIKQNGVLISTSTIPLSYKWNILNTGTSTTIKTLASYTKSATSSVETHYRPKKNQTIVMTTPVDLDDTDDGDDVDIRPTREKLSGVRVIQLKVSGGKVIIGY